MFHEVVYFHSFHAISIGALEVFGWFYELGHKKSITLTQCGCLAETVQDVSYNRSLSNVTSQIGMAAIG